MKKRTRASYLLTVLSLLLLPSCWLVSCGSNGGGVFIENPYDFSRPDTVTMQAHAHTTASDGRLDAEVVIQQYSDAGYDCLAITDHDTVVWPWPVDPQGMVPVPGAEVSKYKTLKLPLLEGYHITSLFCDYVPPDGDLDAQKCISGINFKDGLALISHPNLSGKKGQDIAKLKGYNGIEIYNRAAEIITNKGYSTGVWDSLLSVSDHPVWGYAVDDYHGDPTGLGYGKVVVLSRAEASEIRTALVKGNFFSVAGTGALRFKSITVAGQNIEVSTSGPADITFVGLDGNPLGGVSGKTGATYRVKGDEKYVRVEAVSTDGATTVYSNPFWVARSGS